MEQQQQFSMDFSMAAAQNLLSTIFFSFSLSFFLFSFLLFLLLRSRPWCNCDLCTAYLTSSWLSQFDNLCDWYTHLLRQSPTGTIHIHVLRNTITCNPNNIEYMLNTRFHNFPKGKNFSTILNDFLGQGIFNVDGQQWRFQRKMASLELGSISVRSYAFEIAATEIRNRLLPLLTTLDSTKSIVDLQDVFRRFAFDSICKISFGLDPGCLDLTLPISDFASAFEIASVLSARRAAAPSPAIWKLKKLLNIGSERELRKSIRLVNDLADEVIRQRRKLGFNSNHDLLSRFMGSVTNDDKYLRDIVISFILAGRDTVSSTLTTFFLLLSHNPQITTAIVHEIDETLTTGSETPTYEQIRGMQYLHAALYESMRLFPPVQLDSKYCVDDDVLPDGSFVGRNTRVTYHAYAMGRMERVWGSECGRFWPERWLKKGVFSPENPYKYPVFQGGPRVCLGKEMAIMEMKMVIVAVLKGFQVEAVEEEGELRPRFVAGLTASLAGGLPVRVSRRK